MLIKTAEYKTSSPDVRKCPKTNFPEYAFIGRSNVGKSSLINLLTGRNSLALVSKTPGKTRTINHFIINEAWYLVDLPGYGYARQSKTSRTDWEKMVRNYLLLRENLCCLFVLIDASIPPQKIDIEFINSLGEMSVPFALVYTKTDKVSALKAEENIAASAQMLSETWETLPTVFSTSSAKKAGREELLQYIEKLNEDFS